MAKAYQISCPKCNNHQNFYQYGKDKSGNQKYLCRDCGHQFAPDAHVGSPGRPRGRSYPSCPVCGKTMFLHHDQKYYSNYRCCDKKCNHSIFVPKPTAVTAPPISKLFDKTDFRRMRYPVHVILIALTMFYLGKNSFRNISLILRTAMNIRVSHTTVSNWCTHLIPPFQNIAIQLIPMLNFNSDEWLADETVVMIAGVKHYLWRIMDSETRFVLGFHLSLNRDSPQAFSLLNAVKHMGQPGAVASDRYSPYKVPVKSVLDIPHIRVRSFHDDTTNNLIAMFLFFFNLASPHSALNNL